MSPFPITLAAARASPFAVSAAVGLSTLFLPPAPTSGALVIVALVLCGAIGVGMAGAAAGRFPTAVETWGALAFLVVIAFLREAQGGAASGYAPLCMLPVFWLALHGTRRALAAGIAGVAILYIGPLLVIGGPSYPETEWRRALLWTVVSALVGFTVHGLVARSRSQAGEQGAEREFVDAVLGTAGSLVMVIDRGGRIERFNQACERVSGWTSEEMRFQPFWRLLPAGTADRARADFARLSAADFPASFENQWVARDGGLRTIAWTHAALLDGTGRLQHVIATGTDVTGQRQTEELLEQTEGLYREVLDGVRAVVFETDASGRWTYLNPAWADLTGYPVAESVGRDAVGFMHPEDHGILRSSIAEALADESHVLRYEHRYLTSAGHERWVEVNARLIVEDGHVSGVRGTMTDVTPRREAEEELRRQQRFADVLLETLDTGIVACDEHGELTLSNRATRELHGLGGEGVPREHWARHYDLYQADGRTPLDTAEVPLVRALNGERVRGMELVIAPPERAPHTLVVHAQPIHDVDGKQLGAVVAMHDITERKQLENDLRSISEIARLVAVNADARKAVVQATQELTGSAFSILYEPDEHDMLAPTISVGIEGGILQPIPVASQRSGTALAFRTGRPLFAADAAHHPNVLAELVRQTGAASILFEPASLGDEIVGVLVVAWTTPLPDLKGRQAGLAQLLSREAAGAVDRARHHRGLERAAHRDVLTDLPNRRAWERTLANALKQAAVDGQSIVVAILDLNSFKALNDDAGHSAGDRLLKACGGAWRETLRPTDTLARLGGDEFAALLLNCNASQAAGVAGLLRDATPHLPGAAVGVAQWDGTEEPRELMERADAALYADKGVARMRRLLDPDRLQAVMGALAAADPVTLDELVGSAAELIGVPVALVSLVDDHRQVFPGQFGLPEPWATERSTPLSHSFCQHVVTSSAPLVIEDARLEPLVHDNLAIGDLNVIAYAGVPIIDRAGHPIGALCAIDGQPRQWQPEDLAVLQGLAPTVARRLSPDRLTAASQPVHTG